MMGGSILVVCTGNICRSPVGEALLAHNLGDSNLVVSSAGTRAMVGSASAPEATDYIQSSLGNHTEHKAIQLTAGLAEASDLILTMTEEHRAWVTHLAPRTVRRAYTMLEFARMLPELGAQERFPSLKNFVSASAPLRGRANTYGAPNDITDPYGGSPEEYAVSFALIADATHIIATEITKHVRGGS